MKKITTIILPWVIVGLLFVLLFVLSEACKADVAFVNGSTNAVEITGEVEMTLQGGQSFSFSPSSSATNSVTVNGTALGLVDGTVYAVNPDGSVSASAVLRSNYDDDSTDASLLLQGLGEGAGIGALLFGWGAVKKALRLGDMVTD